MKFSRNLRDGVFPSKTKSNFLIRLQETDAVMHLKDTDELSNTADPDQTPLGAVCTVFSDLSVLVIKLQSTLVISKSKRPSETLRDIHTSTYQMCRTEENTKRTTKFLK